uniref:Threonylcarbamoyl-AMP synthase n=1 Tax=uncultured bacterium contig00048 TaxID=1181533 RepID=A0A806KHH3_9BACT|nr:YrdC/Sua5 family protein [uncultured bacterium contig00048]
MKTQIYRIDGSPNDEMRIKEAGEIIKRGGLVAFPTETVYGLGGDALNPEAAAKIYAAKGRPTDNPLIVHLCRTSDIEAIVRDIPPVFYKLADAFWPGPLTVVLRKTVRVPDSTTGGLATVAVRMPDNQTALALIEAAGGFVAAPSANRSGRPSPTTIEHVIADMDGCIEMIIDDGAARIGIESTILDLISSPAKILRPGHITEAELSPYLGTVERAAETDRLSIPLAPGMKYRHYAPKGKMTIVEGEEEAVIAYINERLASDKAEGLKTGVIASRQTCSQYRADSVKCLGDRGDEETLAHNLYRILREFDDEITDVIYSEAFASENIGEAIMDRLSKAAQHNIVYL